MSSCAVYKPLLGSYLKYRIYVHCAFVSQFRDPLFHSPSLENKSEPMLEWGKARDRRWRGSNYFSKRFFFLPDPPYFSPFSSPVPGVHEAAFCGCLCANIFFLAFLIAAIRSGFFSASKMPLHLSPLPFSLLLWV